MERWRYSRLLAFTAGIFIAVILISSDFLLFIGPFGFIALLFVAAAVAGLIAHLRKEPVDPVRVYALLAAAILLSLAAIVALSMLGPYGLIVLILLLVVGNFYLYRRDAGRRFRASAGLCIECGYDLLETTDRCPECGAPLPEELLRRRRIADSIAKARQAQLP